MTITLSEMLPVSDGKQAARFAEAWYGPGNDHELIQLDRMRTKGRPHPVTVTTAKARIIDGFENANLDELIYADGERWNVYHSVGFLREVPPRGRRGGKASVKWVPGVYLDLDANKESAFSSEAEIYEFLARMPLRPTITVRTGSGGVHAYWKTNRLLEPRECEYLGQMWWALAGSLSGRNSIDRVYNPDRILRTPGSVRWPKGEELPSLVELGEVTGQAFDPHQIAGASDAAWRALEAERRRTRDEIARRSIANLDLTDDSDWNRMIVASSLEDSFNERYGWAQVLEPHGWRRLDGYDGAGRVLWSRPGGEGRKAATTDWPDSPHVMSLFSTAPETGLLELHDAGITLTKYRVYIQLWWHGDEAGYLDHVMRTGSI